MEPAKLNHIWEKCQANDRQAQFSLYQLFAPKLYAICIRYAQDEDEAQDILQNGFVRIFHKAHQFEGTGSLEGWIKKIMIHTAIEQFRKNKKQFIVRESDLNYSYEQFSSYELDQFEYKDLLAMIKTLPLGYKTVFNLYAIEGYSHKEIAEMLQISEGNSKSQLSRARQWLKARIIKMEEQGI
ncbi:RNA polymerase sigma factor [Sphingobacterium sp. HJSM2_6]|uniref:RNA polymerase sigma factor n=1 Tax=Sphingobacterium sp. HJSM2_6 TaxID=3366264 RepID=UPI003BECC70C